MRALDRLCPKARGLVLIGGWERLVEQPVGVRAPAAALDQQVAGLLGEERPQVMQLSGLVDVDPQRAGMRDGVLAPPRALRAHRGCDEQFLASIRVHRHEREERVEPAVAPGGAAGQEVVGAHARVDVKRPVASRAGGQLDEPG